MEEIFNAFPTFSLPHSTDCLVVEKKHGVVLFDILSISGTSLVMKQYTTAVPAGGISSTVI